MAKFKAIYSIEGEYEFEADNYDEACEIIDELDYPELMRKTYKLKDHLNVEPIEDFILDELEDDYPFEDVDIDECGYNPFSGGYDYDC